VIPPTDIVTKDGDIYDCWTQTTHMKEKTDELRIFSESAISSNKVELEMNNKLWLMIQPCHSYPYQKSTVKEYNETQLSITSKPNKPIIYGTTG